jgi:hypothetical protein
MNIDSRCKVINESGSIRNFPAIPHFSRYQRNFFCQNLYNTISSVMLEYLFSTLSESYFLKIKKNPAFFDGCD